MKAEDVRKTEGTVQFTRLLYSIAAITLVVISLITLDNLNINSSYSFLGLVYLGLVPTLLGHNMFYYSLKYITPTIVATIPLGEPVIASIIASYIFLEAITLNTILGGSFCIIGIGVAILSISKRRIPFSSTLVLTPSYNLHWTQIYRLWIQLRHFLPQV